MGLDTAVGTDTVVGHLYNSWPSVAIGSGTAVDLEIIRDPDTAVSQILQ